MDKFYIDRQFGQPIFIDVENGIVQDCYNEADLYNRKMNEYYKGKSISFLKTDFENRMKGTYHNVRSLSVCTAINKVEGVKSKLKNANTLLSSNTTSESTAKELILIIKEYTIEQSKFEQELLTERQRMIDEHKYNFQA